MPQKILHDFEDWWRNGPHPFTSASREYAKEIWEWFAPVINASRDDYINDLILRYKKHREWDIKFTGRFFEYLKEFDLEKHAGIKFPRWALDREKDEKQNTKEIV
jgi:hypothetical protein